MTHGSEQTHRSRRLAVARTVVYGRLPNGSREFHSPATSGRPVRSGHTGYTGRGHTDRMGWYCRLGQVWDDKVFVDVRLRAISSCYEPCSCRYCCRTPYSREGGSQECGRTILVERILSSPNR